jgi:hypothetical protein
MIIKNFVCCGQSGDLTHTLYVLKNLYKLHNIKFNLYIADGSFNIKCCGDYTFSLEKTYNDWKKIIEIQSYINFFGILPINFTEEYINLNAWRDFPNANSMSWSELLSKCFDFSIQEEYKWIECNEKNIELKNKILIHQSTKRHNYNFNWQKIIQGNEDNVLFVTNSDSEYNIFKTVFPHIQKYNVVDIYDLAVAIDSCKFFVGNQSMPFAIASALDIPRIGILYSPCETYYKNESNLSKNLSWFLNETDKYNAPVLEIQI